MSERKITHGIIVVLREDFKNEYLMHDDIAHFCGFYQEPEDWMISLEDLKNELKNDEEFLLERPLEDYTFLKATPEIIDTYENIYEQMRREEIGKHND